MNAEPTLKDRIAAFAAVHRLHKEIDHEIFWSMVDRVAYAMAAARTKLDTT